MLYINHENWFIRNIFWIGIFLMLFGSAILPYITKYLGLW